MFNIIDHKSNYKADFMIVKDNEFEKTKFERCLLVPFLDYKIYVVSKEDLLLSKLTWIQLLQSSVQTDDILNLSELKEIDWPYIHKWISILQLNTFGLIKK